jgi:23S rRNA (adenine2030-N6)-methyltransferase
MRQYDHRVHAGNAGDVWKHFLLLEAADCLLDSDGSLIYAESHAGRPEYALRAPGDWEGGIGKIWQLLPSLRNFCYFRILADLNPLLYPGSARLIYELAKIRGAKLQADVWDNDPFVASSWEVFFQAANSAGSYPQAKIVFHQGDGFMGVQSRLQRPPAGLLFIDPPYIDPGDIRLAVKLLQRAKDLGWIVLWWYMKDMNMMGMNAAQDGLQTFELDFAGAGLESGRWKGAGVAFACAESERFSHLLSHMHRQIEKFVRIL